MAQPNVVREPSMDEILASIRRIIESNEPVISSGIATAMAEPAGFSGRPANDDSEEVTLTVDDVFADQGDNVVPDASMRSAYPGDGDMRHPAFAQSAPAPQKSLSLADVAARVRAASERSGFVRDSAPMPAVVEPDVVAAPSAELEQPVFVAEEPVEARIEENQEFAADMRPTEDVATVREEENSVRPEPATLLSSSTGEQVARSFQDLAVAIDDAQRRSFDEIAEEMLRPMLQEWLDDNLPTLVERLVREEIERVARGPRR